MQPQPQAADANRVTLVVGFDFTEASEFALRLAENLVRPAGKRAVIHVVHVMHPPYWPAVRGDVPAFLPVDNPETTRKRLDEASLRSGEVVDASVVSHVRVGDVTGEIADLARDVHADLIVIGAHKRKGLARALHRSTYARIVRSAPCSVLTALPKDVLPEALVEPPCDACLAVRGESGGAIQWCKSHSGRHLHGHLHHSAPDPYSSSSWTFRA